MENHRIILDSNQIEEAIKDVKASMAMEGFELTEQNIENGRLILSGEVTADELRKEIVKQYQR